MGRGMIFEAAPDYCQGINSRSFALAMMGILRASDEKPAPVRVYSYYGGDLTVAARSEEEARAYLNGEWADDEEDLHCDGVYSDADMRHNLFEDWCHFLTFPEPEECDGENHLMTFRDALDIWLVEIGEEPPFIFTEMR